MPPFNNPPLFEAFCDIERLSHIEGVPKGGAAPFGIKLYNFLPLPRHKGYIYLLGISAGGGGGWVALTVPHRRR